MPGPLPNIQEVQEAPGMGVMQQKIWHSKSMDENGFTGMFHFLSATPPLPIIKDDVFLKWVLGFFLQRREQNFDPLDTVFSIDYE